VQLKLESSIIGNIPTLKVSLELYVVITKRSASHEQSEGLEILHHVLSQVINSLKQSGSYIPPAATIRISAFCHMVLFLLLVIVTVNIDYFCTHHSASGLQKR
jgi:hypothetical protein